MFSGEASPCVSCGISTSSQSIENSKLSSCFAAKLAQDPRSRWHSTTAAASLSPSSRGSESSRAAEGKPRLRTAWEDGFGATSPLGSATASGGRASADSRALHSDAQSAGCSARRPPGNSLQWRAGELRPCGALAQPRAGGGPSGSKNLRRFSDVLALPLGTVRPQH